MANGVLPSELAIHRTELEQVFASDGHVLVAYLFGSQARGQAGPLSDVDIAVLFDDALPAEQSFEQRLNLMDKAEPGAGRQRG